MMAKEAVNRAYETTLAEGVRALVRLERRLGGPLFKDFLALHFSTTRPPTDDEMVRMRELVAAGASAVLAERLLPVTGVPVCVVRNTNTAHGRICQALAGNPSRRLKVIGLTPAAA